jgi:hypothetical protein
MIELHPAPGVRAAGELPTAPGYPDVRFLVVPRRRMFTISGSGTPEGDPAFRQAMETLYPVAYTLHFALKRARGITAPIGALEAVWYVEGDAEPDTPGPSWHWTAMLPVPDEASDDEIVVAIDEVREKKAPAAIDRLGVEAFDEGLVAEITHVGPYDAEGPTLARLRKAIAVSGRLVRGSHHEIYVSDPNRTSPERLRTVIRYAIE